MRREYSKPDIAINRDGKRYASDLRIVFNNLPKSASMMLLCSQGQRGRVFEFA